jgi:formylglycine-generating enzyme required for sulfatase activity
MKKKNLFFGLFVFITLSASSQTLPSGIVMKSISGGSFTMGNNNLTGTPTTALEHQVTLSPYTMSEAEITNAQYVDFLNAAYTAGLIQVVTGTGVGPDVGKLLVQGTASSVYNGKTLYNLDGTRVMKDHDNADNDGLPFTGVIEPENPLNVAYIGYSSSSNLFYVKNPRDVSDFDWLALCNYYDYGTTVGSYDVVLQNDFDDWAGAGQNLSTELQGWIITNPVGATNLPTQADVGAWPVTFIRWWGAKAFAEYYSMEIPTEAQWEYAAKGGNNYTYAVHDGTDLTDANWNQASLSVATGHVRAAISGIANPFGLYNLAGNAWEWIADSYAAPYDINAVTDPFFEDTLSTLRCWRGGSWNYHEATLQSSIRFSDEEDRGNDHFGFRIVNGHTTGVNILRAENFFRMYPNPTNDFITVESSNKEEVQMTIYSIQGMVILSKIIQGETFVKVSDLTKGIYIVQVGLHVKKLIIH